MTDKIKKRAHRRAQSPSQTKGVICQCAVESDGRWDSAVVDLGRVEGKPGQTGEVGPIQTSPRGNFLP